MDVGTRGKRFLETFPVFRVKTGFPETVLRRCLHFLTWVARVLKVEHRVCLRDHALHPKPYRNGSRCEVTPAYINQTNPPTSILLRAVVGARRSF